MACVFVLEAKLVEFLEVDYKGFLSVLFRNALPKILF